MKCSTFVNKLIKLNEHNDIDKIIVHYCGENFNPTVKRAITKDNKKYVVINLARIDSETL